MRYDWVLIFGREFERTLFGGKAEFEKGRRIGYIMDPDRDGERCVVDFYARAYHNPNFAGVPETIDEVELLEPVRLRVRSLCQEIACALGINVSSVSVTDEAGGLHALRVAQPSVYLSMAKTADELSRHLEKLSGESAKKWILTLRNFSNDMPSGVPRSTRVVPLSHYLDSSADCHILRQPEGVSFADDSRAEPPLHRREQAIIKRPPDATYGQLKVLLQTRTLSEKSAPDDDVLICRYNGAAPVRMSAIDIPLFLTKNKAFNEEWLLFRRYAINGGEIAVAGKIRAHKDRTTRYRLKTILNMLFDMGDAASPFMRGSSKGSKTNFSVKAELLSHSPDLGNGYVATSYREDI